MGVGDKVHDRFRLPLDGHPWHGFAKPKLIDAYRAYGIASGMLND